MGYFHFYVKKQCRRNFIQVLHVGDLWVEDVADVLQEIVSYFYQHLIDSTQDQHWAVSDRNIGRVSFALREYIYIHT